MKRNTAIALKWIGGGILVLSIMYASMMVGSSLRLKKAYDALEADGRIMNFDDFLAEGIPEHNNGSLNYSAAALVLKSAELDGTNLYTRIQDLHALSEDPPESSDGPSDPAVILQYKEVGEALKHVRQGTRKPSCRFDVNYSDGAGMLLPHLGAQRTLSMMLSLHAKALAQDGQLSEAWDVIDTGLHFADSLREEPILISQLVRLAQYDIAISAARDIIEVGVPDSGQQERILASLQRCDDLAPLIRAFDGERIFFGDWCFQLTSGEISQALGQVNIGAKLGWAVGRPLLNYDHAYYLDIMRLNSAAFEKPYSKDAYHQLDERFESMPVYYVLTRLIAPALARSKDLYLENIAGARITACGLAALAFNHENGHYPKDLTILDGVNAMDPFTEQPLMYEFNGKTFVIASKGKCVEEHACLALKECDSISWTYGERQGDDSSN